MASKIGGLFAGFDVGRTRKASELIILERKPKHLVYCMGRSFDRFEQKAISIPRDRELTGQIHSIKKMPTEAGYARFDTEKNERRHADRMSLSMVFCVYWS